jgi:hypothetical protein
VSHAYAIALLTPQQAEDVEASLAALMAPYDENREVPEYQTPCYCVGTVAMIAGREEAQRVHGTAGEQLAKFGAFIEPHFGRTSYFDLPTREDRERWDDLAVQFWGPIRATEQAAREAHPDRNAPEADCETCTGTGTYATTRNPMAKWDWYVVGGRWDNELQGRNVAPVAEVDWNDDAIPFAIVTRTPCGWIEKGLMGWFGMASNKKPPADWRQQARDLLNQAAVRGDIAVVVDYHI